ncbi:putative histone deacetylase HDT1-like [Capsicum annuum]|uniref:DUF7054 domain-containing protein n=1 Tax=Capsicum annuum TaxID=4072 RepID=A0A1U8EL28_CAPAN|nr:uncharacterized protein LOC107847863 [Capsicum annuum]KAF3657060.1 putative histone deacetylase HDT1-like [Capsicum annuum]KAF3668094.1 putative histone deacetylase HDT1-like [Capsicum annuum]PHT69143.1 hypothetical protein T459_28630 [Capsicum annuum]
MPPPRNHRKGKVLSEKSLSFHGQNSESNNTSELLRRPRTVPDLLSSSGRTSSGTGTSPELKERLKLTKILLNVTIQRSVCPVQVLISLESSVGDLIASALRQYVKEGRRPVLNSVDPAVYDLHYSQFSLESLDREEKLMKLGSRNFFLCPKTSNSDGAGASSSPSSSSCAKEADKANATKISLPWLKFMDFML